MGAPCIVTYTSNLLKEEAQKITDRFKELVGSGLSEREAGIKVATEQHKILNDKLNTFKKSIGVKETEYKPFDNSKEIQAVHDKYNPLIEAAKQKANEIIPESKVSDPTEEKIIAEEVVDKPIGESGERKDPPIVNEVPTNNSDEGWTAIRKAKQIEIKAVKDSYDSQKVKGWSETMKQGLEKTAKAHPDKSLYEGAMNVMYGIKSGLGHGDLTTDEALATMQYLKREIGARRSKLADSVTSDNDLVRQAALMQDEALGTDYANAALAAKDITTTAGRTLNYAQSELRLDPEHGLQIRRMQLLKAKGGEKLSTDEMKWTEDKWKQEQEINKQEEAIRSQDMQDAFDNKIADLHKDYEEKLKQAGTKTAPAKTPKEKSLSQKGKTIADKIRNLKKPKGSTNIDFTLGTWDLAVEGIAKLVEAGSTIAEAIDKLIKDGVIGFKEAKNKDEFENYIAESIPEQKGKSEILNDIKEFAKENETEEITNDMVGKGLIRDYVNSHIGDVEQANILDVAAKDLKEVLPNVTKEKLIEAYLKENEFKQPTKKDLEGGIAEAKKQLNSIAKLTEDIEDLNGLKSIRQRTFPNERAKSEAEQELFNKKAAQLKEIKERRAKIILDNKKIQDEAIRQVSKVNELKEKKAKIEKGIRDKIAVTKNVDTPEIEGLKNDLKVADKNLREAESLAKKMTDDLQNKKDKLEEMNAGIRRAEQGYDQIKTHRNKTEAQIDEEIAKKQKELKNSIRDNATDEQQQRKALENAKQSELTKIKQYTQKLADGEFTEPEPIKLRKKDAELIALEKKRSIIEEQYRKKQHELQEKNKSTFEVVADFVRSTYVALLIGAPKTLLKVGSMSLLRPLSEAGTKATLGKVFNSFFPNISKVAERGGEGASNAVLKKGFEAYLSTFGEKRMQALADKAAKEYDIARDAYVEHGESNNPNAAKLEELKAKMNEKLIKVQGSFVYNFIGGSAFKDALNALVNRTNEIEKQFGKVESESINDAYLKDSNKSMKRQILEGELNEFKYVLGFIGRSHSALKTFSGRFSFAAGFMARLEGAVKNGEDIISTPKIIEIAHESYLDWERGKYQQSNWISDKWNSLINHLEKGEIGKGLVYSKIAKYILQSDVAITRVPVNILHEAVMEYTLGAFRVAGAFGGDASIPKLMGRLKGELKADGITKDMPEFKAALKDKINQMDEKQAATIARCFRKGGIGVGLYALALISGAIHFGIFPHLGQKKKKEEADLKPDELNPGQVMVGNNKLGEVTSGIIEHIPALWPMFMGLGMAQTYHDDIMKGKSIPAATGDAIYTHLKVVEGGIPQSKVFTATGIQQEVQKIVEKRAKDLGIIEDGTYQGITELTKNYIKDQHLNIHKPSLRQGDSSKPKFEPQDKYNIYVEERAKRIEDGINQLKEKGLYSKATDKEGLQLALDDMIEKANADAKFKAFGISEEKPKRREVINTYSPLPIEQ